jgi:hypothetical protein
MGVQSIFNLISDDDIKTYNEDGVVCLRGVVSGKEVEDLRRAVSKQIQNLHNSSSAYDFESIAKQVWSQSATVDVGQADRFEMAMLEAILTNDPHSRPLRDALEGDDCDEVMFFYDAGGWRFYDEIRKVALDSSLPSLCAKLLDTTYLNFWEDTTFVKAPNTPQRTSFHQDYTYFQIEGDKCCIVWIALDPVCSRNGGMEYIRGSHRWNKTYAPNVLFAQSTNPMSPYEKTPDIEANRDDYDIISFDVEPGDVIIHHVMTVHGSGGNRTQDQFRRAISFRYCGDDIRYFDKPGAAVQPFIEKKLKDGDRLFSKDYPLVWPRPYPEAELSTLFADMPR